MIRRSKCLPPILYMYVGSLIVMAAVIVPRLGV
jgi:hypothetical protein